MKDIGFKIFLIGLIILIILILCLVFSKKINFFIVGLTSKKRVQKRMLKDCKNKDYLILNDIWLPVGNNKCKYVDTIIFGNKYIYIITIIKQAGEVTPSLKDEKWRVAFHNQSSSHGQLSLIDNPLNYNRRVILYITQILQEIKKEDLKSIAVLTKTCRIKENLNSQDEFVVLENNLIKLINEIEKKSYDDILDPNEVEKYCNILYRAGLECEKKVKEKKY